MELRLIAAALLFNGADVLMMHRSMERTLNPGLWATVGGHLEAHEIASPKTACLREIYEETGFTEADVEDLQLRYILLRNNRGELRQQFIYTGRALRRDFLPCDEGELHWVPVEKLLDLAVPFTFRGMLEHYLAHRDDPRIWMGIPHLPEGADRPSHAWTPVTDPLV